MTRFSWIAPLYGYVVCVISVVTFLVNVSGFVDATFDRSNPLSGRGGYGPYGGSLSSFEAFRATYDQNRPTRTQPAGTQADTLTTQQMRERYEALRAAQIEQSTYQSTQRLVKHGLLILLSGVLFWTHWRWLRKQRDETRESA